VDLGDDRVGFVDVMHLPDDPDRWPPAGREGFFEVLQIQRGQVRLFPLDDDMRPETDGVSRWSAYQWRAIAERHPVGSTVVGTVSDVCGNDREYGVRFDDCWSVVDYDGAAPEVGDVGTFVVTGLLDSTRRILVTPARTDKV
jgi:hypothetical protein